MKVFISGKITNCWNYRTNFNKAENDLGYEYGAIFNPAKFFSDIELDHADYLHICFAMIDIVDTVAFLPNWEESIGSKMEMEYAKKLDKNIIYLEG